MEVKSSVRSVLAVLAIGFGGIAMAQTSLSAGDCNDTLVKAFGGLKIVDTSNPTAYSYALKLDTTVNLNGKNTTYTGWLKLYDNADPTAEQLKAEVTLYNGSTLMQRTVADGIRVWSYDPSQNAYCVNAYNVESGTNAPHYRSDFISLFKQNIIGTPQYLLTLMDQASITGTTSIKDWLGGIRFEGQQFGDETDASRLYNIIWQKVPDGSRFVQFNTETRDGGLTWFLTSIQIHRLARMGSSTTITDTYLTVAQDQSGTPLSYNSASPDFVFVPPARSRVWATPRTVKF